MAPEFLTANLSPACPAANNFPIQSSKVNTSGNSTVTPTRSGMPVLTPSLPNTSYVTTNSDSPQRIFRKLNMSNETISNVPGNILNTGPSPSTVVFGHVATSSQTAGNFSGGDRKVNATLIYSVNDSYFKGNIIIGILAFSIISWATGLAKFNGIASAPPPMTYLFEFDLSAAMTAGMSTVIFTLLFIDFFDTAGTLTSVANVAGKVDKKGKVQDINKAMLSDSVSTVAGAMMGTTTVTSYVESGAGVKAGGRTGMTSLVIGLLFLSCIFFAPLATSLPKQIDGAALLFVSVLFVRNITDIEWNDIGESAPAILAMITMPLTYSISNGIALAFVSYALIRLFTGKASDTSPAIWVIAVLSLISFVVA